MSVTEPVVSEHNRTIKADWVVKTDHDGHNGAERKHIACFTVMYLNGRVKRYVATIGPETEEEAILSGEHIGFTRGYVLFASVRVTQSEPVTRFSPKQLHAFYESALAELERRRGEPEIARFFDPATY